MMPKPTKWLGEVTQLLISLKKKVKTGILYTIPTGKWWTV
jgi:hypothetical protein